MTEQMNEKILRWLIYFAGVFCLFIFLSVRILPLFNAILSEKYIPEYWENTKYGELYYMNYIRYFREEGLPPYSIKYRFKDKHPELNEADLILFGDSYFDFSRMTTFPEQLSDSTGESVFYARNSFPLDYLAAKNYSGTEKRYMIYETAERFLTSRFDKPQTLNYEPEVKSAAKKTYEDIEEFIFPKEVENNYSMLLSRSYFTTHIYSAIATLKFDWFGQINSQTPVYYLGPDRPWLFGGGWYGDGPDRYSYEYPEEEIDTYCNNIRQLSADLKKNFNIEMIFMIIPSKYTIYHNLLGVPDSAYSGFIPKMYAGLEKRGIPVIKIYDDYMAQRDSKLLYYGTDTHWTEEGLHIALEKALNIFDTLPVNTYHAGLNAKGQAELKTN
jgi:hypothetical protein